MSRWIIRRGRKLNFLIKMPIPKARPIAWATAAAAKIPKAPKPTKKNGRSILQKLKTKLIVKTYLVCRCAKKIESVIAFTAESVHKKIKISAVAGVLSNAWSGGEIMLERATNTPVSKTAVAPTSSMPVLSLSFGRSELGKKRIKVALIPMRLRMEIRFMTEMRAVASPMSPVEKSCALISKKKNPTPATIAVADMRYKELR